MRKKQQQKTIKLGPMLLDIVANTIGQGPLTVGLVCGLHGVETTSLFLLEKIFRARSSLKNKLRIIPSANPSGLIMGSRINELDIPADLKDPNRTFPGNEKGSVQERISAQVVYLLDDCDFVLDLHNFSNLGVAFPILSLEGISKDKVGRATQQTEVEFLKQLGFKWAYLVDQKEAQKRGFSGTLNEVCNQRGVPSLCIELPPIEFISESELDKMAKAIIKAVNRFGNPESIDQNMQMPILLKTQIIRSEIAGAFTPTILPPSEVSQGAVIGKIFDPFDLVEVTIESPMDGVVLIIKRKNFVRVGEFLVEIAKSIEKNFE